MNQYDIIRPPCTQLESVKTAHGSYRKDHLKFTYDLYFIHYAGNGNRSRERLCSLPEDMQDRAAIMVAAWNACEGVPVTMLHPGAYREMMQAQTALTIEVQQLQAKNAELQDALERIRDMTNADDKESYRSDDREGCLDTVFSVASNTIAKAEVGASQAGTEEIDYSLKPGDIVVNDGWGLTTLTVVDVNWALRAAAVRLGPDGGTVVWPVASLRKAVAS